MGHKIAKYLLNYSGMTLNAKMGPSKVGDVIMPPGPWLVFRLLFTWYSQQDFFCQFVMGHSGNKVEILFIWRKSHSTFRALRIYSFLLCRKVSCYKVLQKFHLCCL